MRVWTLPEANAAIPRVREWVEEGRRHLDTMREAEAQVQDIEIVWGEKAKEPSCPDHEDYVAWQAKRAAAMDELAGISLRFQALGCEVKDLDEGLVDFRGRVGEEYVYLCWKYGEADIKFWHALEGGFASRRPIPGAAQGSASSQA
jgi:hypothetical protein